MNSIIKFDKTRWQGKLGGEITFANLRLVVQGYINFLKNNLEAGQTRVILSYDCNFISKKFAREAARVLSINGIEVFFPDRDLALCTVSLLIVEKKIAGALDFRKDYRGLNYFYLQILNNEGQLIMPSQSLKIESEISQLKGEFNNFEYPKQHYIFSVNPEEYQVDFLLSKLDIALLKKSSKKFVLDNMFGSSRDIIERIMQEIGVEVISIHNFEDPSFGAITPVINKKSLSELCETVIDEKKKFGIAIDKDCSNIAVIDGNGKMVDPELLQLILLEYLIETKNLVGGIVVSVFASVNMTRLAERMNRPLFITIKDEKFLSREFDCSEAFVAIEDSKSMIFNNKVKLKNGILYSLLIIELLAENGFDLRAMILKYRKIYPKIFKRSVKLNFDSKIKKKYLQIRTEKKHKFSGKSLLVTNFIYGIKFDFKDSSLLVHHSQQESVLEITAESVNRKEADLLLQEGRYLFE
jgi:phosphoglucomutase